MSKVMQIMRGYFRFQASRARGRPILPNAHGAMVTMLATDTAGRALRPARVAYAGWQAPRAEIYSAPNLYPAGSAAHS